MAGENVFIIDTLKFCQRTRRPVNFGYEPIRPNRFIVNFPYHFQIPSFLIQKLNRPKLRFINNEYVWDNIEIEFIDVIGQSASAGLMRMIEYCQNWDIERIENQPLFSFTITDLDPTGLEVETYIIEVKELVLVDFGKNDYSDNDNIQKCKLTIKPIRCRIQGV